MQRRISNSNLLVALGLTLALTLGLACSDDDVEPNGDSKVVDKDGGTKEAGGDAIKPDAKPLPKKKVIILHTNDLHDHLQGWPPTPTTRRRRPATTRPSAASRGLLPPSPRRKKTPARPRC